MFITCLVHYFIVSSLDLRVLHGMFAVCYFPLTYENLENSCNFVLDLEFLV